MPTRAEGVAQVTETAASGRRPGTDDAGLTADAPESFDDWVAARGPSLAHFAHLVTGSRADAQDAMQDAPAAIADADVAWSFCLSLPRTQRAAVVLRYYDDQSYDDQSYAQIADLLGCTESTARSHVRRALIALRARLEGDDE
jgi:DNA-directed RNA polymerase specialized sigma24 family protein